ncbi:amino acid adenylation domain-containing protein [Nonomuraea zeae]|uniref:non-ribosomal peptide synthetase family protein n=1 Tax=Nonomuraea zeae TaxID=1642303 RepID=UPI0019823ACB|nr:amino acid adenylation domain-containing protein [Nonomuraea zeae]
MPVGVGASLPDLLLQQAESRPDAVAVTGAGGTLTYRELVAAAGRLAARLQDLSVGADDCVGLYAESSADLVTGVWGILMAGAAYLPLSPEYPEDRVRFMIEDSRATVVVTQGHLAGDLALLAPPETRIVEVAAAGSDRRPDRPAWRPGSLAYVIYTSGSTGRPKGVLIEHHSIASQMRWMHTCGHVGPHTTVLQKTPASFDAAQWEILAPAFGGRIVTAPPGAHRDPQALIDTMTAHEVTTLQCVPTLLEALVETGGLARCTALTRVFSGGEALSRRLARAFFAALPGASLINLYGPTECTINATAHVVEPWSVGDGGGTLPIGVPVDNTHCFVLDESLAPVDIGETGELYIGGVQLARGYLNRPEQSRERFVPSPFVPTQRLYRTGDLAYWNPDGTLQFAGRADDQIKLRGHRIELNEVALAVERHAWVRRAAAVVVPDDRTRSPHLVVCAELDPREAALMDQGRRSAHHRSKADRLQVRAQLADAGLRPAEDLAGRRVVPLRGRHESAAQRRAAFARKTYRFYEGGPVTRADLLELLAPRPVTALSRHLDDLGPARLGEILRWFGQFRSDERLLPKYAYASPGALYATQLYLETSGVAGLSPGVYYYHPADHALIHLGPAGLPKGPRLLVHLAGRREAIQPVYQENVHEVLEFEAGHMVGVFEDVLPGHGLGIRPVDRISSVRERLGLAPDDHYVGTFEIRPHDAAPSPDPVELYVQAHPGRVTDLRAGQYRYRDGGLERISHDLVQRRHVVAINQQVYDRAAFGLTMVSREVRPWLAYVVLGARLHHLQRNGLGIGLMSSGYSSKSGHPTPAARRVEAILSGAGQPAPEAMYFALGGGVSAEQIRGEDMREDAVHMKGPAELIKDELARLLPAYMLPNRVLVVDALPLTANGKVDAAALRSLAGVRPVIPYAPPATRTERWLAEVWGATLKYENVSATDEFFACGGDSLSAVALVNRINREFGTRLPFQALFDSPRLTDLAALIDGGRAEPATRLVSLGRGTRGRPVFCWPGLGGYPMNLRRLARQAGHDRPFYGVQAYGLNPGEVPYPSIQEMAAADLAEIRRVQPAGPYTLWGYSFGARVAFEAARQLEEAGERVDRLILICPGNPEVHVARHAREASYANPEFLTILLSVFTGTAAGPEPERVRDEDSFVAHVRGLLPELDEPLVRRIARLVGVTYGFAYRAGELSAPVTVIKAAGDDDSFAETVPATVTHLEADHYGALKEQGVAELARAIHTAMKES